VKKGKTPVLNEDEARQLLNGIPVFELDKKTRKPDPSRPNVIGHRDRAVIAVCLYSFARIEAALGISAVGKTKRLSPKRLTRHAALKMIQRRARQAGLLTPICCHSFRATGITN
jgi:hypothetical protein